MANTINGGSHSSTESLNGKFRKRTKRALERKLHSVKIIHKTNGGRLVVICNSALCILSQARGLSWMPRSETAMGLTILQSFQKMVRWRICSPKLSKNSQNKVLGGLGDFAGVTNWAVVRLSFITFLREGLREHTFNVMQSWPGILKSFRLFVLE